MKVLIDTNVVLDVLCKRNGFYEAAAEIMRYCEISKITGVISALTIPNIVYIMRKELDAQKTRSVVETLQLVFLTADLTSGDIKRALVMNFHDFEDALQSACASRVKADFIVTRNIKDFTESAVPAITPSELLRLL
ncbi:MAG: PIN domain-containing protein [Oscillospiraceae bacterium]|nr:PIN domain-containing protein [Oscillospiraceae bacterium]MCD8255533.1 PIN domain-containing protein [Oscillospiraceae bacterium]